MDLRNDGFTEMRNHGNTERRRYGDAELRRPSWIEAELRIYELMEDNTI